jgi:hypothetical protein
MNCKPGDLAVIVKAVNPANLGQIVRCVSLLPRWACAYPTGYRFADCWRTEQPFRGWDGTLSTVCPDEALRPIRDQDGEDETLTWAGKPEQITV